MSESSKVDERIAAVLSGSGLPVDRRAEVAEELRDHLEQCIAAKRGSGMPEDNAVAAALAAFGAPEVIRKQLRRQQRILDRQAAWAEVLRKPTWGIWVPVSATALYTAAIAIFHPLPLSPVTRCAWGLCLFVGFFLMFLLPMYGSALFGCGLRHQRPREEYHALRSFLRGAAMGAVGLGYMHVWVPLWGMPVMPLFTEAPEFARCLPSAFWHIWWVAVRESAGWIAGLFVLGVLGFGIGVAIYERSRCVAGPGLPAWTTHAVSP